MNRILALSGFLNVITKHARPRIIPGTHTSIRISSIQYILFLLSFSRPKYVLHHRHFVFYSKKTIILYIHLQLMSIRVATFNSRLNNNFKHALSNYFTNKPSLQFLQNQRNQSLCQLSKIY